MKRFYCVVNDAGIAYIKDWIERVGGHDDFGPINSTNMACLEEWAMDAEESMRNGHPAMIEMPARDTASRRVETVVLPHYCLNVIEYEADDDYEGDDR